MNRKLFMLAGCFCLLGTLVRAQAPVAQFSASVTSGCAPLQVTFHDQSANHPTSWEWSFGNGQTSNQQNPTVGYAPGTYTVTLIVKNASGADAIREDSIITVYASPTVSFSLSSHLACAPAFISFQNNSTAGQGQITSYIWNFGDGTSTGGEAPQHQYTQTGYYSVTLTATNSGGCSTTQTYTRTLRLVDGVQTNFTWSEAGGACTTPFNLNFLNQTAGPGTMTYNWSFGGGAAPTSSGATNPSGISYPSAGTYPVTLIAYSSLGCADTLTQNVPLTSNTPVITAPASGCINNPISFSNGSNPAPISSSWTWGDGTPGSSQPSTTHTYTAAGTYMVTLTNTYANCTSTTSSNITIGSALVPTFTAAPVSACQAPLTVQFTDQTSPAPTQWSWDFGDGSTASGSGNPIHTYTSTGNYTVKLTATTPAGCSGTTTQPNEVNITAPTIHFASQGACIGQAFTPIYSVTSIDSVASYSWSAPGANPSTSTSATPSFSYSAAGFYNITLTITTKSGCSATATINNAIQVGTPIVPTFTYSPPSPICGTAQVSFTATYPTNAIEWYWNFGDGTATDSGLSVNHVFSRFGGREVTLTVNNNGCQSTSSQLVTVNPPIPKFGYVVNCAANNPTSPNNMQVSFIDSTLYDTALPPLYYVWNFGDSTAPVTVSSAPFLPPPHTYPGPGSYTITLAVTNGSCTAYAYKTVTLLSINAQFTASPNPVCNEGTFTLTSTSETLPSGSSPAGYTWNITPTEHDNGGPVYSTHIRGVGSYPISLTVIDQNACQYTSNPITVNVVAPTATFTAPPGGCVNGNITFTDNSTPSAKGNGFTNYIFYFGDSTAHTFTAPPFTHQYADTGSYTVIETVVDNGGCIASDTLVAAVQITSPHALFFAPDSFYCPNTPLTFKDLSVGYGLTEVWNFGDSTGNQSSPTHTFPPASGVTYPVTLTVTDKYGCTTDTTGKISIESPMAAFTIADTTAICAPLQAMFNSTSQNFDSLYWEFGDGQTSTLANTSHFYNSLDTFTATLVVRGPGGCLDSASRKVFLTNPNTTVFTFTPKTACDSVVAQFNIVPPPFTTFTLQFGDNTADSSQLDTPVHTYRSPNTFYPILYLTDATGCIAPIGDSLLTVLGAVPFFTATPVAFCDSGTVTFNDYTITNNGVQSKMYTFGDGQSATEGPPQTAPFDLSHYYNTPGMLSATLTVVTQDNCTASYTDTIRVYQTPRPLIADSGRICAGLVQFLGQLAVPDADTIFWNWNFGDGQTANVQNPLVKAAPGTYNITLIASVSIGCSDTTSGSVTVNPNPTIKGPKELTTPVGVPVTIPFTYSPDVTTWSWTPAANLSCTDCANPAATLTFAQTYTVLVTDSNNCIDTASVRINTVCNEESYFFPNTFSPNGDGVNDYFYPRGNGLYNIQSLTIFNRWGQIVFQRKDFPANAQTMGWDGTFNGNPAPSDAYVFIAEVVCNNAQIVAIHGNVTLVR